MSIMQFRHCLLFNYRQYLRLSSMHRSALMLPFMAEKFLRRAEIIVTGN